MSDMLAPQLSQRDRPSSSLISTPPRERIFVMFVGINDYKKQTPLYGCVNDVDLMDAYFKKLFNLKARDSYHSRRIVDASATKDNIQKEFRNFFLENDDIHANDLMVFYFAGHGSEAPIKGHQDMVPMICPYDYDGVDPAVEQGVKREWQV
ncbi:hypothetical protein EVJ58_g11187 [Rhodofomes roseus]|uniref:Peptidase C14 caspase domain-containing protein n=1 Tax=Rhodofomes roseus TaxID=34475 RepID=A0A4Y9XL75_9APHY|nr:hypothetical protein EVJ58_g11187 [Rhodofomes roseus]